MPASGAWQSNADGRRAAVDNLPRDGETANVGRIAVNGPFQQTLGIRQVVGL